MPRSTAFKALCRLCPGLLALALVLATTGCRNNLEVKPQGFVTDEALFATPENAKLGVNGCYNVLRFNQFNEGLFPILDIMADDYVKGSNPTDALSNIGLPYDRFQLNASTTNSQDWYAALYVGVRRTNSVIERVPSTPMDATLRNRYLAEARFLRALFYLDLARAFGNVPLVTTVNAPPANRVRQASAIEIYNEIIKPDLDFARQNLPLRYTGEDLGRATSGAANGLLARAALFFKDWAVARDAAVAVINSNVYSLEPNFIDAFSAGRQHGPESVFEIGATPQEDFFGQDLGGNQYGNVQGVRGSPNRGWGFNRPTYAFLKAFEPGDVRRRQSFIYLGDTLDGIVITGDGGTPDVTIVNGDTTEIEVYNRKVWTPGNNVPTQWGHNRRYIRYADVLLMAAEALVETGGDASQAAGYINQVRARARGGNPAALPDVLPGDDLRQAVYRERRFELASESSRFYDLVRTGRTELMVPMGFVRGKHELQPIPQTEIDISGGHLKQNPQY